jgi:uncharacterized protein YeaO (DUF488 family)
MIAIKRVYDPPAKSDGLRVLVDRLWPRGLTKQKAALDLWAKELAPSPELRVEFDHKAEKFAEFRRRYRIELGHNPAMAKYRPRLSKGKVTLLYGARDPKINHAVVLKDYLAKAPRPKKKTAQKKPAHKPQAVRVRSR